MPIWSIENSFKPAPVLGWVTAVIIFALTVLTTPALAQQGWNGGGGPGGSGGGVAPGGGGGDQKPQAPLGSRAGQQDPYSRAMALKQKGNYAEAMPLLEQIANIGRGYEIAQLELGKCYFDVATQDKDKDSAQRSRTLGLGWILESANGGLGSAQEQLVRLLLDGNGLPADPVEAGKWYLLWKHNPARIQLGAASFDATLEQRLKEALQPADWNDAQQRADAWHPFWLPPRT
jgi:hypothetical protein